MSRFLTLTRHGLRRARQHTGAVLLVYLAALVPALLAVSLASADLAPVLDRSLFAERTLEGESFPVVVDYLRSDGYDLSPLFDVLPLGSLLVVLLHVLVAAGVVEGLLERAAEDERPLLSGMARHGFRFVRSALVFALVAAVALFLVSLLGLPFEEGDGLQALYGLLLVGGVGALVYVLLDLPYDFSRISAAAHGDGRMLVGYFKTFGFTLRHLGTLLPLYLAFALPLVALHLGAVALRPAWGIDSAGEVLGWFLVYQAVLLLAAFLRVGLWGAEVAYFQGLGEPRWCGRKAKKKGKRKEKEKEHEETGAQGASEAGDGTEGQTAGSAGGPSEEVPGSVEEVEEPPRDDGSDEPSRLARSDPWGAKPAPGGGAGDESPG